jgi:GT2 family glycosyltransferase
MRPAVTLVVVPRERFSRTRISLESLYRHTAEPFNLIYVDGHSPRHIRKYLEGQARERGFRLIRLPHFMPTPQARNIGLREVDTPYVVFIENDMVVEAGWLDALLRCAEETGAPVVGPLYLERQPEDRIVHMAGGLAHVEELDGKRRFFEKHRFQGRRVSDVEDQLHREPTELAELHCLLVRTELLRQLGGFDEGLKNTSEHVDFCLAVREAGHQVYFEPTAVVVYVDPPPFAWYDLRFFHTRWNDGWARQTVAHFGRKWRLDPDDPFLRAKYEWTGTHRRLILAPVKRVLTRACGWTLGARIDSRLTPALDRWIGRTIARPAPDTLRTSPPPVQSPHAAPR